MSRHTTVHCDRCGDTTTDYSVIELQAGPIRRSIGQNLDLCKGCTDLFHSWLRSGRRTSQDGPGEALQATAVASMPVAGELA